MPGGNCSIISGIVADVMKLMKIYWGLLPMAVNVGYCQKVVTDVVSGGKQ